MTTNPNPEALSLAIYNLSDALDPDRQGDCWPGPIAWDGRPLAEQASDLLALVDDAPDGTVNGAVSVAAADLRTALAFIDGSTPAGRAALKAHNG